VNAVTLAERQAKMPTLPISLPAQATRSPVAARQRYFRKIAGYLEDAVLLMLAVFLLPVIILLLGAPIALCIRAIIEIVRLFS